jgi:hypothetical protein
MVEHSGANATFFRYRRKASFSKTIIRHSVYSFQYTMSFAGGPALPAEALSNNDKTLACIASGSRLLLYT